LLVAPFAVAYDALVEHPRLAELWPEYLILQHQIIRATVPLTEAALARSRELDGADPLAAPLAAYFEEHVEEELDHDETLLGDLEVLKFDRATVLERIPSPAVAGLAGSQYYWILHHHPVAFLGYVALMEGYPPTPELIDTLIERTGYPREAFRTYEEHAELDPGHRDRLDRTIDSLPLEAGHEMAMGISAIATASLAARSLEEILEPA
jgi:heme oxygenase-like protein